MLADKRYERIVEITDAQGFVKTRELADLLGVSETTIRRDRKSTRLNSSHRLESRMPSSA